MLGANGPAVAAQLDADVGGANARDQLLDVSDAWGGTEIAQRVGGADDSDGLAGLGQSIAREVINLGESVGRARRIAAHAPQPGSGLERDAGQVMADDVMNVARQAHAFLSDRALPIRVTKPLDFLGTCLPPLGIHAPGTHHVTGEQRQQRTGGIDDQRLHADERSSSNRRDGDQRYQREAAERDSASTVGQIGGRRERHKRPYRRQRQRVPARRPDQRGAHRDHGNRQRGPTPPEQRNHRQQNKGDGQRVAAARDARGGIDRLKPQNQ